MYLNNNYQLIYVKNSNMGIILENRANSAPRIVHKFAQMEYNTAIRRRIAVVFDMLFLLHVHG